MLNLPTIRTTDTAFTQELKSAIIELERMIRRQRIRGDGATFSVSGGPGGLVGHASTKSDIIFVAASNSSTGDKVNADYVCDGTADNVEIQQALDKGSWVHLHNGTYSISAVVYMGNDKCNLLTTGFSVGWNCATDGITALSVACGSTIAAGRLTLASNGGNQFAYGVDGKNGVIQKGAVKIYNVTVDDTQTAGIYVYEGELFGCNTQNNDSIGMRTEKFCLFSNCTSLNDGTHGFYGGGEAQECTATNAGANGFTGLRTCVKCTSNGATSSGFGTISRCELCNASNNNYGFSGSTAIECTAYGNTTAGFACRTMIHCASSSNGAYGFYPYGSRTCTCICCLGTSNTTTDYYGPSGSTSLLTLGCTGSRNVEFDYDTITSKTFVTGVNFTEETVTTAGISYCDPLQVG